MRRTRIISVPYHDGRRDADRGCGPEHLLRTCSAAVGELVDSVETVGPVDPAQPEAARVFQLADLLGRDVRAAHDDEMFPLVLAGDCNSCVGTVAGCGGDGLGVVWLDAHPDFDTSERSRTGSLDAMGLAVMTGHGWAAMRRGVTGFTKVAEEHVIHVGGRDFEPGQREDFRRSGIRVLEGNTFADTDLAAALDDLRARVSRAYLHIDLDCLDPSEGIANQYSADGGLSLARLLGVVDEVFDRFEVAAAAVTAYHPGSDVDGRMASAANEVLAAVMRRGGGVGVRACPGGYPQRTGRSNEEF
nr:arginase family protein [Kibdelosporangium sp. MJ126-NF4]CTQ91409.1 Arginase (EC 3.5.3.1) [Kibdelosporangium sp. MJ126-NF4]